MKKILLFFLLLSPFVSIPCQNVLFLPFGQTREEIKEQFQDKDYVKRVFYGNEIIESQVSFKQKMRYHLKDDLLYAVEDERQYVNKKEAERVIQACLEYMKMGSRKAHVMSNKGGLTHYALLETNRVVEFWVEKKRIGWRQHEYTLTLKVTSRYHGPRSKTEALAAMVAEKMN